MIDLEQEFQLLMRTVFKQIEDKVQRGELTRPEANQLITMVNIRLNPTPTDDRVDEDGWSASTRACMEAYEFDRGGVYEDDGWSGSHRSC